MNKLPWTFMYFADRYKEMMKKDLLKVTLKDTVFKSLGFSFKFLPFYKSEQGDPTKSTMTWSCVVERMI